MLLAVVGLALFLVGLLTNIRGVSPALGAVGAAALILAGGESFRRITSSRNGRKR